MRIAVVGAGVIGVTTAFALRERGHEVTLIDRRPGAALETSFANGGLLTPSMTDPWNGPGCWKTLAASIGRSDSPLQLRLRTLPSIAGWGLSYLANSSLGRFKRSSAANLKLAVYSRNLLRALRSRVTPSFEHSSPGSLRLFRNIPSFERAWIDTERLRSSGIHVRQLTTNETIAIEPQLVPIADDLEGSIYCEEDEVGDAHKFSKALATRFCQLGGTLLSNTQVVRIEVQLARVSSLTTNERPVFADQYIVCAGSYSRALLNKVGINIPVQPAKGYSISIPVENAAPSLKVPLVDDLLHAVVVPFGREIRVAGTAEFAGFDLSLPKARLKTLANLVPLMLPQLRVDMANARPWCGLRPMSADGVPVISATKVSNLFINSGHGHLGWTLATGSAQLISDIVLGTRPAIEPEAYSISRF